MEKCGFKLEGLLRENDLNNFTFDGHEIKDTKKEKLFVEQKSYKNVRVYGLLKNEYQLTK